MLFIPKAQDRSPYGDFWFTPVGSRSFSGVRVNGDSALRMTAVFACVRVLAETFASLPFGLWKEKAGGGYTKVTDHWLVDLFCRRPNEWQTPFEWREMIQGHLCLRGNAYNRLITNSRGEITAMIPLHPDRVRLEVSNEDRRYKFQRQDGSWEIILPRDLWHIRGLSSDGYMGLSPIEVASEAIGLGLAAQEYGARYFANNGAPSGGWIEHPTSFKDQASREVFKSSWQAATTGDNRHKVSVLEFGMKYHELGLKNNEAQFLESRNFQVLDIARVFRVPPHKIGELSRATFSNIEHQSLEFVQDTMAPWAERWEAAIESDLLLDGDRGLDVEFDFVNLLRGDSTARANFYGSGITNGWMTRNEARISERLNPVEGLDAPLMPLNMTPVGESEDAGETETMAPTVNDDIGESARLRTMIRSTAHRMARRFGGSTLTKETVATIEQAMVTSGLDCLIGKTLTESELAEFLCAI